MLIYLAPAILATITGAEDAPFVITLADAHQIDNEVDLSKCELNKSDYARYYWYDGIAEGDYYKINLVKVRFAVVDDKRNGVKAVVYPPFDRIEFKFKAIGVYEIGKGVIILKCNYGDSAPN